MSSRKGGGDKRTRKPAHQNAFAFRHNPKSKKTAKILSSPNVGLCPTCHDKIEWRKKYRKYRPLRQPAVCNGCHQKTITAAYHRLCMACARERRVCPFCATAGRSRTDETEEGDGGGGGGEGEGGGGAKEKGGGEAPGMELGEETEGEGEDGDGFHEVGAEDESEEGAGNGIDDGTLRGRNKSKVGERYDSFLG